MGKIQKLPFDLYQRYELTKELTNSVRKKNHMLILDVGGHPGIIGDFFPKDETFIIDLKIVKRENFIKADCEFLPFKDEIFDLTVNLDVMEHIPKEKRIPTLGELVRVSKKFLIIGAPFDSKEVRNADSATSQYFINGLGKVDENLGEHTLYGLPSLKKFEIFLNNKKFSYLSFPNGFLNNWIIMQELNHSISEKDTYDKVNELYNQTFYEKDNRTPSYRKILLIEKNLNGSSMLKKKTEVLRKKCSVQPNESEIAFLKIINRIVKDFADQTKIKSQRMSLTDQHVRNLEDQIKKLNDQIEFNTRKIELTELHVQNLEDVIENYENRIRSADEFVKNSEEEIRRVEESLAWKLISKYRNFNDRWFPSGTRRRRIIDNLAGRFNLTIEETFGSILRNIMGGVIQLLKGGSFFELSLNEQYKIWLKNNQLTEDQICEMRRETSNFSYRPLISLIMPVYNTNKKLLRLAIESVNEQIYSNWELCIADDASTNEEIRKILQDYSRDFEQIKIKYLKKNLGIVGASNEAMTMAEGEFIGFIDHDDELQPNTLFEFVKLLNQNNDLDLIYSDEDKKELSGQRVEPFFKPDWSPDLLMSMNYISHFTIYRKNIIDKIGGFREGFEGSQDYDLVLRFTELTKKIAHIPMPLYNWCKVPESAASSVNAKPYARKSAKKALGEALKRRGLDGEVLEGFGGHYRVRYDIRGSPMVSIIIPTKDKVELLKRCIESIDAKTLYKNYEIIILDNDSTDPDTLSYLKNVTHRVERFNEPFNFSKINNFGAKLAKGDHLLFLNNDTEIIDGKWLESMLEHSQRPEVGAVGALLLYPGRKDSQSGYRKIQHAGVVLGVGGVANHAFRGLPYETSNYFGLHRVVRNCSVVTAASVMLRKDVFEQVGGFDEDFEIVFQDVDLCLRVREKGYSIVYTPYSVLHHNERATRRLHPEADEHFMIDRWKNIIIDGDPYYNPNLTLLREDYSLSFKGSKVRPMALLIDIYNLRPDLQSAFPEVKDGKYDRLKEWVVKDGLTLDDAKVPLRPYGSYFLSNVIEK
jgi:GT2 family glycosyltransferase